MSRTQTTPIHMLQRLGSDGRAEAICGKDLTNKSYVMEHQKCTCPKCLEIIHAKN